MQHLLHAIHAIAWKTQNGLFWFETVCHTVKNRYYTTARVHLHYIRGLLHALHVISIPEQRSLSLIRFLAAPMWHLSTDM